MIIKSLSPEQIIWHGHKFCHAPCAHFGMACHARLVDSQRPLPAHRRGSHKALSALERRRRNKKPGWQPSHHWFRFRGRLWSLSAISMAAAAGLADIGDIDDNADTGGEVGLYFRRVDDD